MNLAQKVARVRDTIAELQRGASIGSIELLPGNAHPGEEAVPARLRPVYAEIGGLHSEGIVFYSAERLQTEHESRVEYLEDGEEDPVPLRWREIGFLKGGHLLYCDVESGAIGTLQEEEYSSESIDPATPTVLSEDPVEFFQDGILGPGYLELGRIGWSADSDDWRDPDWTRVLQESGLIGR